jgi:hypothetical protein
MLLNNRDVTFCPPTAERVSMLVFAAGVVMLAMGLVIEYYRLVH